MSAFGTFQLFSLFERSITKQSSTRNGPTLVRSSILSLIFFIPGCFSTIHCPFLIFLAQVLIRSYVYFPDTHWTSGLDPGDSDSLALVPWRSLFLWFDFIFFLINILLHLFNHRLIELAIWSHVGKEIINLLHSGRTCRSYRSQVFGSFHCSKTLHKLFI